MVGQQESYFKSLLAEEKTDFATIPVVIRTRLLLGAVAVILSHAYKVGKIK